MSKPKIPNQRNEYKKLNARLNKYVLQVEDIYTAITEQAAQMATRVGYEGDGEFRFSDYPQIKAQVDEMAANYVADMENLIYAGTSAEWANSNLVQDLLVNKVLKAYDAQVSGEKYKVYYDPNSEHLKAFQQRRDRGMNLSQRLWNQSSDMLTELEETISTAIQKGMSAVTLSKRVSKYLQDFPKMQKDYAKRYGKATRSYDCEYRSIRLARSEINMAYRSSENERWRKLDFVVGYEIKVSHKHTVPDICDDLAGKYPKDFEWVGWHPNCTDYKIPILKTEDEFFSIDDKPSVNEVKDVPDSFKKWCVDNKSKITRASKRGTLPYFVRDNRKLVDGLMNDRKMPIIKPTLVSKEEQMQKESLSAIAKNLGVTIGKPMSFEEANALRGNPHFTEDISYRINCQTCVVANELRRRGIDVEAIGKIRGGIQDKIKHVAYSSWTDIDGNPVEPLWVGVEEYYKTIRLGEIKKKVKRHRTTLKSKNELSQLVESHIKEGERWTLAFNWEGNNGGHIICLERVKGKIRYYDPQCGKSSDVWPNLRDVDINLGARILRVDNLVPNVDVCSKILQKAGAKMMTGVPSDVGEILGLAEIENKIERYYKLGTNKERVQILREIVDDRAFRELKYHSIRDHKIYSADIRDFDEKLRTVKEMPKNITIAKKLLSNGYDVYLMPNHDSSKSADFIIKKGGLLYYTEAKTLDGKGTLNHLISKGASQSDRIIIDIIGTRDINYIRREVSRGFESMHSLRSIILLKGNRLIEINRQVALGKDFDNVFRKIWSIK